MEHLNTFADHSKSGWTPRPQAALLVPRAELCELPLAGSTLDWIRHDAWEGSVPHPQRYCGAAAWLTRGTLCVLRAARASLSPLQPLVAFMPRKPTPMEFFRLLEVGADVVEISPEKDWPDLAEQILAGRVRGVALLQQFCKTHRLSPRESLTVYTACAGLRKVEAHEALGCSPRTLDTYWSRVFDKTGIHSSVGVVAAALRAVVPQFGR